MNESKVWLLDGACGSPVEASLFDEISEEHLKLWNDGWRPVMKRHAKRNPQAVRPEDSHWDWRLKFRRVRRLLSIHGFTLVCSGELQALMIARDFVSAKLPEQEGKPMVYVEFLATAPWNRPEFQHPVRFKGCGRILILAAIEVSRACGGKGRIGLHSLPAAEAFYEQKCGMVPLGRDDEHQGLMYLEMSESGAREFRQNRMK